VGSAPLLIMRMHVATATYLPPKKKFEKQKNDNKQITPTKKYIVNRKKQCFFKKKFCSFIPGLPRLRGVVAFARFP